MNTCRCGKPTEYKSSLRCLRCRIADHRAGIKVARPALRTKAKGLAKCWCGNPALPYLVGGTQCCAKCEEIEKQKPRNGKGWAPDTYPMFSAMTPRRMGTL